MSAKNIFHDAVIRALTRDGWTITDDPLTISYGGRDLYVDLGAERTTIGAEKGQERIAVEVQSFLSPSPVRDLEEAVGQYQVYRLVLGKMEPNRDLFMAVPRTIYESLFVERFGQLVITGLQLRLMVFDAKKETVVQWIK